MAVLLLEGGADFSMVLKAFASLNRTYIMLVLVQGALCALAEGPRGANTSPAKNIEPKYASYFNAEKHGKAFPPPGV